MTLLKSKIVKIDLSNLTALGVIGQYAFYGVGSTTELFEGLILKLPVLYRFDTLCFANVGAKSTSFKTLDLTTCPNLSECLGYTFSGMESVTAIYLPTLDDHNITLSAKDFELDTPQVG